MLYCESWGIGPSGLHKPFFITRTLFRCKLAGTVELASVIDSNMQQLRDLDTGIKKKSVSIKYSGTCIALQLLLLMGLYKLGTTTATSELSMSTVIFSVVPNLKKYLDVYIYI